MEEKQYHVKKSDLVMVMTGKSKGKTGKVLRILTKKDRLIVEKVNMIKKHVKPTQKAKGGIMEKERVIMKLCMKGPSFNMIPLRIVGPTFGVGGGDDAHFICRA